MSESSTLLVRQITNLCRRARLDYHQFRSLTSQVRKALNLHRPSRSRHLPKLLPEASLRRFYQAISQAGNLQHEVMLKLLLVAAVRVKELTQIRMEDVDLDQCKIFIESGKGDKDRYVLFPDQFRLALKVYMLSHPQNRYLFESRRKTKYSTRRIEKIVQEYAAAADLEEHVHPHLLRHQMLTFLTAEGLSDAQIQLVSGHASKKSLEVYQHLSLKQVSGDYQQVVRKLEV